MVAGLLDGIKGIFSSFSAISKYGLWIHVLLSGLLSLLVASVSFFAIWKQSENLGDWINGFCQWEWICKYITGVTDWIVWLIMMVVALFVYKYLMLILSAPILSVMSEKIESRISGTEPAKFTIQQTIKSTLRGIRIALSNISRELLITLILIIIGFFPGVGIISAPLIFITQAYFAGFGNMDFYMERHFSAKESRSFVKRNRGIAIANGSVFLLLLAIPVIGFFIGPTLTAIGASLNVHNKVYK